MALEPLAIAWRLIETHLHEDHFGVNGKKNFEDHSRLGLVHILIL